MADTVKIVCPACKRQAYVSSAEKTHKCFGCGAELEVRQIEKR